jgi:hypothetical protein
LVAQIHQLIDLGDDAELFGQWRNWYYELLNTLNANVRLSRLVLSSLGVLFALR